MNAEDTAASDESSGMSPSGWRLLLGGSSRVASERLTAAIESLETEIAWRITDGPELLAMRRQLGFVRRHHALGELDAAWRCFAQAARWMIEFEGAGELRSRAAALRQEANADKLSRWRSKTIIELLAQDKIEGQLPLELPAEDKIEAQQHTCVTDVRARLAEATRQRDDSANNSYYKVSLARWQRTLLIPVLVVCMALVLGITATSDWAGNIAEPSVELVALVMLFGAIGACLSAIQSLGRPSGRIPENLAASAITIARPVLGAAAALGVYAIVASGALKTDFSADNAHLTVLALAFASGFSERLVVKAVGAATGGEK